MITTTTIKLDNETKSKLEEIAKKEFRSLHSQILFILKEYVKQKYKNY